MSSIPVPPPLVLLHGFAGSPRSWDKVVRGLGDRRKVVRLCLLGHRATSDEGRSSTFEAEVDRLAADLADRRLAPMDLVGYSLGARVGLGLLVRHPVLFAHATLIGVHPGLESHSEREVRQRSDEAWQQLLLRAPLHEFVDQWEAQPLFESQRRLPAMVLQEQRRIRMSHDPRGLARALAVLGLGSMPSYRVSLSRLKLPIRLVVGELDTKFSRLAEGMINLLPRAELVRLPDSGHNPVLERPELVTVLLAR